jgi:hypothetical protein
VRGGRGGGLLWSDGWVGVGWGGGVGGRGGQDQQQTDDLTAGGWPWAEQVRGQGSCGVRGSSLG